jgi:DNA-binding YbaB/EbfC family protein
MFDFSHLIKGLQDLPALQRAMQDALAATERVTADGEAGGGLVRARANGRLQLTELHIDPELLRQPDHELLEELILAACNQALHNVSVKMSQEAMQQLAHFPGWFGMPERPEETEEDAEPSQPEQPRSRKRQKP